MTKNQTKTLQHICQKLADQDDPRQLEKFFRAFFTPKECNTLSDRYQLVQMLLEEKPQREIAKTLGVSISQISRGSAELQFGMGREFFPAFFKK